MSDTLPLLLPEGDRMTGLTIGSLFSGMGGLDRAAEQVFGARTVWVSDVPAHAGVSPGRTESRSEHRRTSPRTRG